MLGIGLFSAALIYIGISLESQWPQVEQALVGLRFDAMFIALAAATGMAALKSVYHVVAMARLGPAGTLPSGYVVAHTYVVSQLVRYLPGKVFGVAYEVHVLSGRVPASRVIATTLIQMMLSSAMTVGALGAIAAWQLAGPMAGVASAALVLCAMWAVHAFHTIEWSLSRLPDWLPRVMHVPGLRDLPRRLAAVATLLLLAEWAPYFLYWHVVAPTGVTLEGAVLIGACYAAASLLANLAIVMPSGLVVREALFLWLGSQLSIDPALLLLLGALTRVMFTLADVVVVPIAWLVRRWFS
jgi:hypothetical protein